MLFDLILQHGLKFTGALVLIFIWWIWYKKALAPWTRTRQAATEKEQAAIRNGNFPMGSLLAMILLTGAFIYYVSMEHSFRDTQRIDNRAMKDRESTIRERDAQTEPPPPQTGPDEDLDAQTEATKRRLKEENDEAKKRFQELPPVESNGDGGAKPK